MNKKLTKKQLLKLYAVDPSLATMIQKLQDEEIVKEISLKGVSKIKGDSGVSVTDAKIIDKNLCLYFSDGSKLDVGRVVGYDGLDGEDGKNGKDGAIGPSGPRGLAGPRGPRGEMGPQGPEGNSVNIEDVIKRVRTIIAAEYPKVKNKFTELEDTPDSLPDGKILATKNGKVVLSDLPKQTIQYPQQVGGGGADRFTKLKDTPSSYASQALKVLRVKSDETGLEFATGGGGGSVNSVTGVGNIIVENIDPANPIVDTVADPIFDQVEVGKNGLFLNDTASSGNLLNFRLNETLTDNRNLLIRVNDADASLRIAGEVNLSGTNSGDQTIILTSDVTGIGSGSFATTISNNAVTYAKMQDVNANSVLARASATAGDVQEVALSTSQLLGRGTSGNIAPITLGSGLEMSGAELSSPALEETSIFGGGEDGNLTASSGTTTLTRDAFYNVINISGTARIAVNGWRLFCRELIVAGTAGIISSGGNGGNSPSATGGAGGTATTSGGFVAGSQAGTAGGTGAVTAVGSAGTAPATVALTFHSNIPGASGKGGDTPTRAGGASQATPAPTNTVYTSTIPFISTLVRITTQSGGAVAGDGGGSGASDNAVTGGRGGGGGGAGGGAIVLFAQIVDLTFSPTAPVIDVRGGNGGNGAESSTAFVGGGGGGSGGSGGYVILVTAEIKGSLANAINASGGNGGNGGGSTGGGGAISGGAGGGSGGGGRIVVINVSTGVATHTIGSNGAVGAAGTTTLGGAGATASTLAVNL